MTSRVMFRISMPEKNSSWGVVRYLPGSGSVPEDDKAAFDGWYADRAQAIAILKEWQGRFPHWIIAVVSGDTVYTPEGEA